MSIDEMIELWQRVLESDLRPESHFFSDLGGDSLLAVELIELVEQAACRPVEIDLLFEHPTPARLLSAVNDLPDGRDDG